MPPSYLAVLALAESPSVERAPRMPGEARDAGVEWIIASAPLWADPELIGTVRLHRLSSASDGHELQHLVFLAARMARALHLAELIEERRATVV